MRTLLQLFLLTGLILVPSAATQAEGNCGAGGWFGAGESNDCSSGIRDLSDNNLKNHFNHTAVTSARSSSTKSQTTYAVSKKGKTDSGTVAATAEPQPMRTTTASPTSSTSSTSSSSGGINCKKYSGTMYDSCMRINERTGHGGGSPTGSGKYPDVGGNGILWKPTSDSDGKLVVLTKTSLGTPTVEILDANGNVIEKGRYVYHANGNRAHYRFSKSGRSYPNGSLLRVNGKIYEVPQTWKRYE